MRSRLRLCKTSSAIHNRERGAVGNSALTWSNSLASQAQGYADQLSSQGYVCNGSNGNLDVCRTAEPYKYLPHGASNENFTWGSLVIRSTRWSRDRSIAGSQKSLIITPKPIHVQGCAIISQRYLGGHDQRWLRNLQWCSNRNSGLPLRPAGQHGGANAV